MDFETALKNELSSISGMSKKVFPSYATEGTSAPYIVYHKYNRQLIKTLDGSTNMAESTYSIIILAETYKDIQTLYKAVRDKVNGFQDSVMGTLVQGVFIKDVDEGFDEDVKLHRMDILIRTYFEE